MGAVSYSNATKTTLKGNGGEEHFKNVTGSTSRLEPDQPTVKVLSADLFPIFSALVSVGRDLEV